MTNKGSLVDEAKAEHGRRIGDAEILPNIVKGRDPVSGSGVTKRKVGKTEIFEVA